MIDYNKPLLNKNGKPLTIGMLAAHHCIRVVKISKALQSIGYTIWGAGNKVAFGTNIYDNYFVWQNETQFKNTVRMMINNNVDCLYYANEPDHPAVWAKEVIRDMGKEGEVSLIVDLHDLDSVRRGFIPKKEREMFNSADALIYVSLPIQEMTNKLHSINKPNICLYSYCNRGVVQYKEEDIPKRRGIVYEGGVNPPDNKELNAAFPYRNLYWIFKRIVEMGNELHGFIGNLDGYQGCQTTGAVLYPPTQYTELMQNLIKFKYGLIGFNNKDGKQDQVNFTLTNKESEYLHAGLPSLVVYCPETEKHVLKHGTGFVFSDVEEIGNCAQLETRYQEVMDNIKVKREELCMENYVVLLENMYADLLGLEKKGIPEDISKIHNYEFSK